MMESTIAVGRVTNRTDGLVSIHIGSSFVELSQSESSELIADIIKACGVRYMPDLDLAKVLGETK